MYSSEQELREAVEKIVPVPDEVWEDICEIRLAEEYFADEWLDDSERNDIFQRIVDRVKTLKKRFGSSRAKDRFQTRRSDTTPMTWRTRAISALVARQAVEREDVIEFRRKALGDRLIAGGDVSKWVTNLRDKEPVLRKVSFFVDSDTVKRLMKAQLAANHNRQELGLDLLSNAQTHGVEYGKLLLSYADESDKDVQYAIISPTGTLGRLKKLAKTLSDCYNWSETEAVIFVLTGRIPYLGIDCQIGERISPSDLIPPVVLSIPNWYTASNVADVYQRLPGKPPKRPQAMGERLARLIVFVCDNPDYNWNDLCCLWNEHTDTKESWKYDNGQDMCTAFNRAKNGLLKQALGRRPGAPPFFKR
jgi:hypothetical protein